MNNEEREEGENAYDFHSDGLRKRGGTFRFFHSSSSSTTTTTKSSFFYDDDFWASSFVVHVCFRGLIKPSLASSIYDADRRGISMNESKKRRRVPENRSEKKTNNSTIFLHSFVSVVFFCICSDDGLFVC